MIKLLKKFSAAVCCAVLSCTMLATAAFAASTSVTSDDTDKKCICLDGSMTQSEIDDCNDKLNEASDKLGMDLVVVFTTELGGKSMMAYSDDFYDYSGYGTDDENSGALLLINYATRDNWISTTGKAMDKLTDSDIQKIFNHGVNDALADADNTAAVEAFIKNVDRYSSAFYISSGSILLGIVLAVVFAVITAVVIVNKYKFHEKPSTANYLEGGNLEYSISEDRFITSHTSKVHIDTSSGGGSSSHSGSSGTSHGGGGSHF